MRIRKQIMRRIKSIYKIKYTLNLRAIHPVIEGVGLTRVSRIIRGGYLLVVEQKGGLEE